VLGVCVWLPLLPLVILPLQFQVHGLPIPSLDVHLDLAEQLIPPSLDTLPLSVTNLSPRRVHGQSTSWNMFKPRKAASATATVASTVPAAASAAAASTGVGGTSHAPIAGPRSHGAGGSETTLPRVPAPSPIPSSEATDGDDVAYGGPSPTSTFNSVQMTQNQLAAKAAEWLSLRPPQAHALVAAQRATGYVEAEAVWDWRRLGCIECGPRRRLALRCDDLR
jgi:hypothetical protein